MVFLDIDGVLLPFPNPSLDEVHPLFPRHTMEALQVLWDHTTSTCNNGTVEWILSSTWRVQPSYIRQIEEALQAFGIPLSFGDITDPTLHSERQWEIYEWLQAQDCLSTTKTVSSSPSDVVWLALDDEELVHGDVNEEHRALFAGHAVRTESHLGLTLEDARRAIQLWDAQISVNKVT